MTDKKATLVFCLTCGHPTTVFNKWDKGYRAKLQCENCGALVEVRNATVGEVLLDDATIKMLEKNSRKPPEDYLTTEKQRENAKNNRPQKDKGFCTLGFRVTFGQREILKQAMQAVKKELGITGRLWHGVAVEYLAAEYLAGVAGNSASTPFPDVFKKSELEGMEHEKLAKIALFTFDKMMTRMFSDDDDLVDWIVDNAPPEYQATGKVAVRRKRQSEVQPGQDKHNQDGDDQDFDADAEQEGDNE